MFRQNRHANRQYQELTLEGKSKLIPIPKTQ